MNQGSQFGPRGASADRSERGRQQSPSRAANRSGSRHRDPNSPHAGGHIEQPQTPVHKGDTTATINSAGESSIPQDSTATLNQWMASHNMALQEIDKIIARVRSEEQQWKAHRAKLPKYRVGTPEHESVVRALSAELEAELRRIYSASGVHP